MRNNPRNWRLVDIEVIARHFGVVSRKGKGSHVSFSHVSCIDILTIPAHRPIKPVYIKKFLDLIDKLMQEEYE